MLAAAKTTGAVVTVVLVTGGVAGCWANPASGNATLAVAQATMSVLSPRRESPNMMAQPPHACTAVISE